MLSLDDVLRLSLMSFFLAALGLEDTHLVDGV